MGRPQTTHAAQQPLLIGLGGGGGGMTVYRGRFHQLAVLVLLILSNAVVWVAFSAVTKEVQAFFDVSSLAVDAIALSFQALFLPGTLLSYWLIERRPGSGGLRTTLLAGGALTTVGATVRLAAALAVGHGGLAPRAAYGLAFAGTALAALAQPMVLNVPAQLASNWFPVNERDLVTSLGFMASPVGNAVGVGVAPLLVTMADDDTDNDGVVQGMPRFLLLQLALAAAATLWAWAVLRDRPPTPPSQAAAAEQEKQHELQQQHQAKAGPWWEIRACLANRDFLVLLWAFGLGCGFFNALMTVLGELVAPCGYSDAAVGLMGGLFLLFGLVGAVAAGLVLDRTHRYRLLLRLAFAGAVVAVAAFTALLRPSQATALSASFAFLGLMMLPILPLSMENAVEATFPTPEVYSSGLLLTAANLAGIPIVLGLSRLLSAEEEEEEGGEQACGHFGRPPVVLILVLVVVTVLPVPWFKGETRRLDAERRRQRRQQEQEQRPSILVMDKDDFDIVI